MCTINALMPSRERRKRWMKSRVIINSSQAISHSSSLVPTAQVPAEQRQVERWHAHDAVGAAEVGPVEGNLHGDHGGGVGHQREDEFA